MDHTTKSLNHTSGIIIILGFGRKICNRLLPRDKTKSNGCIYNKPLEFKPGTRFSYCNSGYFLLGMIIEKLTGKPYEQVVREIIFEPLQMTHSGLIYSSAE